MDKSRPITSAIASASTAYVLRPHVALVSFLTVFLFQTVSFAQTGPGGVSANDGASALQLWFDAYDLDGDGIYEGSAESGIASGKVTTWKNKSGYASRDLSTGTSPDYIASHSGLNNMPVASFVAGSSNYLQSAGSVQMAPGAGVTLFYVADDQSFCAACPAFNWRTTGNVGGITVEDIASAYLSFGYAGGWTSISGGGYSTTDSYVFSTQLAPSGRTQFRDGTAVAAAGGITLTNTNAPFALAKNIFTGGNFLTVKMAEVLLYDGVLNSAQQIIVTNYLAAKYGIAPIANDLYTQDNISNGNFDFEVAGIGRVDASNIHSDAKGSGLIHILNPGGLGDNEFLFWGHNNQSTAANETIDIPAGLDGRMLRVWRTSEVNAAGTAVDVGAMDMRFDLTGLGAVTAAHLRLLVDTDNDGIFSDETPITGATAVGGNVYQFAGVTAVTNGTRFTLATASHATPLNGVRTFYSLASGAWEANTSWSRSATGATGALTAGEFPLRTDNIVIRTGHTITVDNVADNGSPGMKPDDLARANIGPFSASNLSMFYQTGDIQLSGTLSITGIEIMTGGYVKINTGGTLSTASSYVTTGYLEAATGSNLSTLDDLILTGNSITILNTNSISADDLIIDHTDATLCGTGTTTLQNGSGSTITFSNSGSISQVCTTYTVACSGAGCSGTFPVVGTTSVVSGNTGPGGIGSSSGNSTLNYWYRADANVTLASGSVTSWGDASGHGNTLSSAAGTRPTSTTSVALNGQPVVHYAGASGQFFTGPASPTGPGVDNFTFFLVANGTSYQSLIRFQASPGSFVVYPWEIGSPARSFIVSSDQGTSGGIASNLADNVNNIGGARYRRNNANGMQTFLNGAIASQRASANAAMSSERLFSGRYNGGSEYPTADVGEMVVYYSALNDAQMVVVENYLAAKFNATLSANDAYTMDNSGSGDFDYDVAGVGMAADGSSHRDALGTGIVRMWNPNDLSPGEFMMWGSTNAIPTATTKVAGTTVDGTIIKERLTRVWGITETGDVGTVSLSFNVGAFSGGFVGSNLRLLVDHDGDGFVDNDVSPVSGSFSNNTIVFSYNFSNGDRFTLGNTNLTQPLPIGLFDFDAKPGNEEVIATWTTLSETNNDFFSLERSADTQSWSDVARVDGAGTTTDIRQYIAHDREPVAGRSYYRLKQTDYDGYFSYSKIVTIDFDGSSTLTLSPNPTASGLITIEGNTGEIGPIRVMNVTGQDVPFGIRRDNGVELNLSQLPSGMYLVRIVSGGGIVTRRIIRY